MQTKDAPFESDMNLNSPRYHSGNASLMCAMAMVVLSLSVDATSGCQLLSPPSKPLDAKSSVPIRQLMTADWERDPSKEAHSKQTFANATHDNPYLLLAYALNRIHQNRTQEAKMACEELTARYPDNLDGWLIKTWLNTLANHYDVALINMRSMKKQIAITNNLSEPTQKAIYKRLGKLIGYMQGPVNNRINGDLLDDTVLSLADGIDPKVLKVFNENRDKVLQAYDDLVGDQGMKIQAELAKVKAENDREAISLEKEVDLLEQTESRLEPEKERLRSEANKAISNLEQQASSIQPQLDSVYSSIRDTQLDLQYLYIDLNNINLLPPGHRPSTFFLLNQIRNAELNLGALRNEGALLSNQLVAIGAQITQIQNNLNAEVRELEREIKRVNGAKRRNLAKLAKFAAGPKVAVGKRNAMRDRATALRTYDELPVELYRQELLDTLTN